MNQKTSSTKKTQGLKTVLHLAKQNFKFSAAHFLIFDAKHAERLHGHNYQVKVDIFVPVSKNVSEQGYFVDFNLLKKKIKSRLDEWDEVVLLPELNSEMNLKLKGESLELRFRDRFYVFPNVEVRRLPLTNTSVEQLSQLLAEKLLQDLSVYGIEQIRVTVEETRGQSASCLLR